jgi:predicted methyltransferase
MGARALYRILILTFVLTSFSSAACAREPTVAMAERIQQQLQAPGRNQYDAAKDVGRRPVETAEFIGVRAGMTVLDMIAGGGYNTEVLAAAVGPEGVVYAQNSHLVLRLINGAHHDAMVERLAERRLPNVRYMVVDARDMPFAESVDLAMWGFNFHDVYNADGEASTLEFLSHVHRALKPGGIFAITDHVGEAQFDNAELHRIDPVTLVRVIKQAGFEIEAQSDLLANPDDDHSRSVYADGLRYSTDRLLIRARKPL